MFDDIRWWREIMHARRRRFHLNWNWKIFSAIPSLVGLEKIPFMMFTDSGYLFGALLHGFKSRPHYHSHYPAYGRYGPYGYHGHAASVVRWGCGKILYRLYNHNLGAIQFEQLPGEQFQKQGMMTFSCKWSLVIFTWKPLNSFTWNINLDIFIWIDNYCSYTLHKDGNKEILFTISVLLSNNHISKIMHFVNNNWKSSRGWPLDIKSFWQTWSML